MWYGRSCSETEVQSKTGSLGKQGKDQVNLHLKKAEKIKKPYISIGEKIAKIRAEVYKVETEKTMEKFSETAGYM